MMVSHRLLHLLRVEGKCVRIVAKVQEKCVSIVAKVCAQGGVVHINLSKI